MAVGDSATELAEEGQEQGQGFAGLASDAEVCVTGERGWVEIELYCVGVVPSGYPW